MLPGILITNERNNMPEPKLSIIIPCKNEEDYIGILLSSLRAQRVDWADIEIIIADAASTDRTPEIIKTFEKRLPIQLIPGDLPGIARNKAAKLAKASYILFIDADMRLIGTNTLEYVLQSISEDNTHMATCNLITSNPFAAHLLMKCSNFVQNISTRFSKPYATSMFMLWRKEYFLWLGGFDTKATHCEDVLLARKVPKNRFTILPFQVNMSPRRIIKNGYLSYLIYFFKNIVHINNQEYFYKDIGYWN
jgi:glycosyltransferase involved in cell wall biosynthesis